MMPTIKKKGKYILWTAWFANGRKVLVLVHFIQYMLYIEKDATSCCLAQVALFCAPSTSLWSQLLKTIVSFP